MIAPSEVQNTAKKLENENLRFRKFLKAHADSDKLDQQFIALHHELFSEYDCYQCGNCCRAYGTVLTDGEIDSIATSIGVPRKELVSQHLIQGPDGYEIKAPCCFLDENGKCQIQDCRPAECRSFPYTDRPKRLESLLSILSFAEECPVVFEIIERLKGIYRFKR